MSKKKVFLLTLFGIFVMYMLCTVFMLTYEKSLVIQNYYINTVLDEDSTEYTLDGYIYRYLYSVTGNCDIPCLISVYDSDGNFIKQSGSMLEVYEEINDGVNVEYVYLDKYLTPQLKKQINDMIKIDSYYESYYFSYYRNADNEIVPCTLKMQDANKISDKVIFKFSEEPKNQNVAYCRSVYLTAVDTDNKSMKHKLFEDMREIHDNETNTPLGKRSRNGGWIDSKQFEMHRQLEFKDGEYDLFITTKISPVFYALTSSNFSYTMNQMTFVFVVVSFAIIFVVLKLYNKNKRIENMKYAFINAAAHELKTPIAVIENQCECIIENVAPEKNDSYVKSIYEESLRMNKLVSNLLKYNRLTEKGRIDKKSENLSEIVNEELKKYESYVKSGNLTITSTVFDDIVIKCNREMIALVIDNFLSNAVKFAVENSVIKVFLTKQGKGFEFSVFNEGEGIKYEDKDNIWELFYSGDKSRNNKSTGIGLAISKQILELHGFKYGFKNFSNPRKGVKFYFTDN